MSESKDIKVMENIMDKNDAIALDTQKALSDKGIFCINVMGAPGAGKTTTITALAKRLSRQVTVIEGDIESDIDTKALNAIGVPTVQINTHGACHLDSPSIAQAIDGIGGINPGYLFIENIGNLVCPAEFNIGEHMKLLIVSAADGSDKPYKYPLAFEKADLILVNKYDLAALADFDEDYFLQGIRRLHPDAKVIMVSAKKGEGMDEAAKWLEDRAF